MLRPSLPLPFPAEQDGLRAQSGEEGGEGACDHAALRADLELWRASTVNERAWPSLGLNIAECRICGSSICTEPPEPAATTAQEFLGAEGDPS